MPKEPLKFLAKYAFTAPHSGTVNTNRWLDDAAAADPRIKKVKYYYRQGQKSRGPLDGYPSSLAEFMVISEESAEDACQAVRNTVIKHLKPPIFAEFPGT